MPVAGVKRIAATGIIHTPPVPLPDGSPGDPIRARPLDNAAAAVPGGEKPARPPPVGGR